MTATSQPHPSAPRRPLTKAGQAVLLAALLGAGAGAEAHRKPQAREPAQASLVNFAELAQHRPRKCTPALPPVAAPAGWDEKAPLCVWQGRLEMRRWSAPAEGRGGCVAPPAHWWAWQRARVGIRPGTPAAAWNTGWKSQYVAGAAGERARIAIVELQGASWTATEWTWAPSPRAATRAWQQGRWEALAQAAARARSTDAAPPALRAIWEKNLNGRPGDISPAGWRWQSEGKCLSMLPMEAAASSLPLPYAREDARLEQRAAMQIQLARRYPQANFVVPFRLLDAPPAMRHSGAKYIAIWTEKARVTGQLWIPLKSGEPTVRARIEASLPARYDTPAGLAAGAGAVRAIERELAAMAATWSAEHER